MFINQKTILKIKNLHVCLNKQQILENINFEVKEGDILAIVGPNGSGKTVLLKTILGIFPYEGEIIISPDVTIGYVPQRINLDPYLKVTPEELFRAKQKILKIDPGDVENIINIVGLNKNELKDPLNSLSGGDLQKILIILALIGKPKLLLFDEPTANVDIAGEKNIYEALRKLQKEKEFTLILVSHDINVIHEYTNHLVCINKQMVCFGETHHLLKPETIEKIFGKTLLEHHLMHHQKK